MKLIDNVNVVKAILVQLLHVSYVANAMTVSVASCYQELYLVQILIFCSSMCDLLGGIWSKFKYFVQVCVTF